jgi:hypothetical protein
MKKKFAAPALPSFEEFRTDFLGVLNDYYAAESLVPNILKDKALSNQCAALLWECVNDTSARYTELSKKWCNYWDSKFEAAILGAEASAKIYANLINQPEQAESMLALRNDLLERRRKLTNLPQKALGQKQDWTIVRYAKDNLESLLCRPLPGPTLAALLNAANVASGRKNKEHTAQSIGIALTRLSHRLLC